MLSPVLLQRSPLASCTLLVRWGKCSRGGGVSGGSVPLPGDAHRTPAPYGRSHVQVRWLLIGSIVGEVTTPVCRMLRDSGLGGATVLSGQLRKLLTVKAMADKKYANFLAYSALYPERRFVFVGDRSASSSLPTVLPVALLTSACRRSGQGDILAALDMLGRPNEAEERKAAAQPIEPVVAEVELPTWQERIGEAVQDVLAASAELAVRAAWGTEAGHASHASMHQDDGADAFQSVAERPQHELLLLGLIHDVVDAQGVSRTGAER